MTLYQSRRSVAACPLLSLLLLLCMAFRHAGGQRQCSAPTNAAPAGSKTLYRVGVLAFKGIDTAYKLNNGTLSTYLSATAGRMFDPPIGFEMVPVPLEGAMDAYLSGAFDFVHTHPSMSSCVESELGANSLVSKIAVRKVNGEPFEFSQFGGVIFTQANRTDISSIEDIRGKRVACASIAGLGSGQMQFRELQKAGLHFLQDPAQVIFMGNQGKVVKSILKGQTDVGYVRTDQLERFVPDPENKPGELLDLSLIKIVNLQEGLITGGRPFPFPSSTPLYPEWNVASLESVNKEVAEAVQSSLLVMDEHAAVGQALEPCYAERNCTTVACRDECFAALVDDNATPPFEACTTRELADLAADGLSSGKYGGWRPTLSYMELRNMQEETGFIRKMEGGDGAPSCIRSTALADAVVCPPGHFKLSDNDIVTGCERAGIPCYGFDCVCGPCVKAFDVEFHPVSVPSGCSKFAICGEVEQSKTIAFRATDNKKRIDAAFEARVLIGTESEVHPMIREGEFNESRFVHRFNFSAHHRRVGVVIVEVYAGNEQIPESPFRLQIASRDCPGETGDPLSVADTFGECVCRGHAVSLGKKCVPLAVLLPSVLLPAALLLGVLGWCYVNNKRRMHDSVWQVAPEDLIFDNPARVLGRGSFGLVLLAEYRGTQVAVKRVLPPKDAADNNANKGSQGSFTKTCSGTSNPGLGGAQKQQEMAREVTVVDEELGTAPTASGGGGRRQVSFGDKVKAPDLCTSEHGQHWNLKQVCEAKEKSPFDLNNSGFSINKSSGVGNYNKPVNSVGVSVMSMRLGSTGTNGTQSSIFSQQSAGGRRGLASLLGFKRRSEYSKLQQELIQEMRLISALRHPNITTVMGAVISRKSEPMLVMEYMELGSLGDMLHNESMVIDGDMLLPIIRDIAKGLRFLHQATPRVVHGDLKAMNVLVDSNFKAKVADFGLAQKVYLRQSACGTPYWMAPELLRGESSNTPSSDMYAFGVVLYEIFSRKDPYEGEDPNKVLHDVAHNDKRPPVPPACPREIADLMTMCLKGESAERPSAEEIDIHLKMLDVDNLLYDLFPRHVATALRDGRKVEPEPHDCVTVFFSDIVGYTEIASGLSPTKVSNLLDRLYTKFDKLCTLHNVFKVETVGDSFMGVTNLAVKQEDHAHIIALFALDAVKAASDTLIDEADPSLGTVEIRCGFHSGPVVAHVVGTKTPRYSLIGDTVNIASRMESHSWPNKVQITEETAVLLTEQSPNVTIKARGVVHIKGKGEMNTYWVEAINGSAPIVSPKTEQEGSGLSNLPVLTVEENEALVNSNVEILIKVLKRLVRHRQATKELNLPQFGQDSTSGKSSGTSSDGKSRPRSNSTDNKTMLDEVKEMIPMPEFNAQVAEREQDWESVVLSKAVITQLHAFVTTISHTYRNNPFHNFAHASQVLKTASEFLQHMVAPASSDTEDCSSDFSSEEFGTTRISVDPMVHFAVIYSALIHDVDHPGVPNARLVEEQTRTAIRYKGKSISEQNSVDLAWGLFMDRSYRDLRSTVCSTEAEMARFRQLVINAVMATDICDKELVGLRTQRWNKAYGEDAVKEKLSDKMNRRATIVIEHMLLASDVGHTMSDWQVYRKWNERFFIECLQAYKNGRAANDPAQNWYKGEFGFFDFYVFPLAKKLQDCGAFGAAGRACVENAKRNRREWENQGQAIVAEIMQKVQHNPDWNEVTC